MLKKMIFHIPYKINYTHASGTNIRPQKLIKAFEEIGYQVELIEGYGKERKEKINELKSRVINGEKFDFLYSESSTMPTLLTEKHHLPTYPFLDFEFFKFCKKKNIKIGLFYRDIHWNFEQYKVSLMKKEFAKIFYKYDLRKYGNLINILFLPSNEMKKYIPLKKEIEVLESYPGLENINSKKTLRKEKEKLRLFYVGGSGVLYDYKLLIESIGKFSEVELTICTREEEWVHFKERNNNLIINKNIKVVHYSGNKMECFAKNFDIGILYLNPLEYWKFAMPLKIFQYLKLNLPILAVNGTKTGKFVIKNNVGWAIDYDRISLEKQIKEILNDKNILNDKRNNIDIIKPNNTWEARARKIKEALL